MDDWDPEKLELLNAKLNEVNYNVVKLETRVDEDQAQQQRLRKSIMTLGMYFKFAFILLSVLLIALGGLLLIKIHDINQHLTENEKQGNSAIRDLNQSLAKIEQQGNTAISHLTQRLTETERQENIVMSDFTQRLAATEKQGSNAIPGPLISHFHGGTFAVEVASGLLIITDEAGHQEKRPVATGDVQWNDPIRIPIPGQGKATAVWYQPEYALKGFSRAFASVKVKIEDDRRNVDLSYKVEAPENTQSGYFLIHYLCVD
jgi:hypothetical protein